MKVAAMLLPVERPSVGLAATTLEVDFGVVHDTCPNAVLRLEAIDGEGSEYIISLTDLCVIGEAARRYQALRRVEP